MTTPAFGPFTIETLAKNLEKLSHKDQEFALSLLTAHKRCAQKGWNFSPKQAHWCAVLAERATAPAPEPAAQLGDMAGLYALFEKAAAKLKRPAIVVATPVGAVRLSLAGAKAKFPGTVNVAEDKPFGEAQFFGRITKSGALTVGSKGCPVELVEFLTAFAQEPAKMAAAHGHATGACCFCSKKLTDPKSLAVGYGPTCADHYGLPWGEASYELRSAA